MKRLLLFFACLCCSWSAIQAQEFAISSNVVDYADFGTLNIGAEYGLAQHWSVAAIMKYNPFSFKNGGEEMRRRQRTIAAGAKYWPWHVFSGWWVLPQVRYQEYNTGGLKTPVTTEGDRFGGGVSVGYTYMVSPHINIDVGAGVWAGYGSYTNYACPTCGQIVDKGFKGFIIPSDIILALSYIF